MSDSYAPKCAVCRDYRKYRETGACTVHHALSAAAMAHHYPQHAQTQGYQPYPAANYGYTTAYYPAYPARPGAPGFAYDPTAAGAAFSHPQGGPPTAPEIPGMSAQLASHAMQRLISVEMRDAGFEAAEPGAIRRLELEVAACTSQPPRPRRGRSITSVQLYNNCMNARMSTRTLRTAPSQW